MHRILIIGPGGAGKSTLARRLGEATGLRVVHLDALYWQPGWAKPEKVAWQETVARLVAEPAWIIDGNFGSTLETRLAACDTAIFLDLPRAVCLWRVIKRLLRYRGRSRPDMAAGCREHISWEFVRWIWTYRRRHRPDIMNRLAALRADQQAIVLSTSAAVEEFLVDMSVQAPVSATDNGPLTPTEPVKPGPFPYPASPLCP